MYIAANVCDKEVCFEGVPPRTASYRDGGTGGC